MDKMTVITLADDLSRYQDEILSGQQPLDTARIYHEIDALGVLNKPITTYFDQKQDTYYAQESDHKLTLLNLEQPLKALHDRILTNHVDGYVDQKQLNFTYNHEDPYQDGSYDPTMDFHMLAYSFKVISAVKAIEALDLKKFLSKDAVLSLGLAANSFKHHV